ncbi:MAG: hypothetical protein EXR36_00870 [Betaproteobacteria bacterium]|nr:hypothetical protein [Betaproteobacteria bacterium]
MRARKGIVWVVLAVLVLVIGIVEWRSQGEHAGGDGHGEAAASRNLLPLPVAQIGAIEIAHEGQLHRFERDAAGEWFYHGAHAGAAPGHEHLTNPILAKRMGEAFAALDKARMEREAPLDKDNDRFGVVVPKIILIVYKPQESQPLAQYSIGDMAPDALVRYVHLLGTNRVITLPQYHIENLLGVIRAASATLPLALPSPSK